MSRFKDLSIRTKFAIIFIIEGFLITAFAMAALYYSTIAGLTRNVENFYLENGFHSVSALIDNNLETLFSNVKDYAIWDDMYNYVNTRDAKWLNANVIQWVPKNFKVDLILIFDRGGKLIYQYGDFEEFKIERDIWGHPLIKRLLEAREAKGLYFLSKGLAFIAASQILHTDESSPRNGTYVYAKLVSRNMLKDFNAITGVDLSIITEKAVIASTLPENIARPKNFEDIYNELRANKFRKFSIFKPDYQSSFLYSLLKDMEGKDIGMLEIIRPRKATALFRDYFIKIGAFVFILAAVIIFFTVVFITGIILRPLDKLSATIEEIEKTKDMLRRVKVESQDEIGILASNFNIMMDTLNKAQEQLVATQQRLVTTEKMATAAGLAMGAVHQINNLLSIAIGRIQMLRRLISYKTAIPDIELEKDLKIVEEQSNRAIDITNSLLRYAVPVVLRFEKCNINELVKDAVTLIKQLFDDKKMAIIENFKKDLPLVQYCDPKQTQDVFINIMTNAYQAMTEGGELEVSTDYNEKDNLVLIKFSDNGIGIAPENISKLFTPFFSTKADRSGLGLAISYNVVKGHRGVIEVESQLGTGSIFTVKLPVGANLVKED